jgi:hypothetical protein
VFEVLDIDVKDIDLLVLLSSLGEVVGDSGGEVEM